MSPYTPRLRPQPLCPRWPRHRLAILWTLVGVALAPAFMPDPVCPAPCAQEPSAPARPTGDSDPQDLPGVARVSDPTGYNHGLPDTWRSGAAVELGFFPGADHDPAIPSPEQVLGFPLGAHPLRHAEVVTYLEALAEASPRVRLIRNGKTHEGRALITALVTDEQHMERLGEILQAYASLADPRLDHPAELEDLPVCVWLGACVHGDEISGTEAALEVLYHLAAGRDTATQELRQRLLVLVEPLQNPDGRDRAVSGWQSLAGAVPDADDQSLRHEGYWSRGRTNHYFFDLNRDWILATQPETVARLQLITSWNPHVIIDAHEMGSQATFLFSPPREPYNPLVTDLEHRWWDIFAADNAAAFDREGWPYYTGDWHEEWYPGFATSWAAGIGAVGLLHEQARTDGARVARLDGSVLTFRESIQHQLVALLSNLTTAAAHRAELIRSFREVRRREFDGSEAAFVILPQGQPDRARAIVRGLLAQKIEVYRAVRDVDGEELTCYWADAREKATIPSGALVVPARQPYRRLIETFLAFDPQMDAEFLRTERRRLESEGRSRLYDVTGWSVSAASGLPVYRVERMPTRDLERLERADQVFTAPGGVVHTGTTYGYLIDGSDDRCLAALARLWDAGCAVQAALESFTLAGQTYPRGTLLIRRDLNQDVQVRMVDGCAVGFGLPSEGHPLDTAIPAAGTDPLVAVLESVAARTGVTVVGVTTALCEDGPDLGSPRFRQLWAPRIAVAAGEVIDWTSYGAVAWVLDHEMSLAMTPLSVRSLAEADLTRYDVLVLPSAWGGPEGFGRALGPEGLRRLRSWVYDGGTLVASGSAAAFVADTSSDLGSVHLRRQMLAEIAARAARLSAPGPAAPGSPAPTAARSRGDILPADFTGTALRWAKRPGPMDGLVGNGLPALVRAQPMWAWAVGKTRAEIEQEDVRQRLFRPSGALLRVNLDPEHWLSAGCAVMTGLPGAPLATHAPGEWVGARIDGEYALVAEAPVAVVGAFATEDSLRLSGLLWPEARERWAQTAYLTREPVGRGQIILFDADPCQRGTLEATERAFLNAVLLGPGLGTIRRWTW
jgi:hypothetical protein